MLQPWILLLLSLPPRPSSLRVRTWRRLKALGAVALKSGVANTAQFKNGIAVFVKPIGGAMFDASVAGQKFSVKPM